tara:strand:+ start:95 stop:676 length:582 start_codon:yes stop_codon:yes gene_type:complete
VIRNLNSTEILKTFVKKKESKWILYFISFIESIIFPIPTDPFLIPFIITEKKFYRLVVFTTLFSVLGGIVAYFLGSYLWESLEPLVEIYFIGIFNSINEFEKNFLNLGILLIIFGGISPFPFKVTCLASGILGINFAIFVLASTASRGIRFLLVSYLIHSYGEKSFALVRKHITIISVVLLVIIITMTIYYLN